jgi:HEPN domain-containing protein
MTSMEPREQIGRFRRRVDVSIEYARLAREDEQAANLLADASHYRQAVYFVLQAMEKHLRAKIFTLVDPTNEYFRQANRNHSVEDAAKF